MKNWWSYARSSRVTLMAVLVAGAAWYILPHRVGWWPMLLVLAALMMPGKRFPWRRTALDGALLLFMLTALVGVWTAFAPEQAWQKLRLLSGALAVYVALTGLRLRYFTAVAGLWGGVGTMVACYFLLTHDWVNWPTDIALLTALGRGWMVIRPTLPLPPLHPNAVGGIIAVFLPLGALFVRRQWKRRHRVWLAVSGAASGITLFAWLLTSSRGAWLSLLFACAVVGWYLLLRALRERRVKLRWLFGAGSLTVILAIVAVSLIWPGGMARLASMAAGQVQGISRLAVAGQTFDLIQDFPYTGGGLAAYGGLYSQYVRVVPFFYFGYAHNLYLDIWLEQGPLGLAAFLSVLFITGWWLYSALRRPDANVPIGLALTASLVVMAVHGLIDDALYGELGTPFLWVVPGLTVAWVRPKPRKQYLLAPAIASVAILGVTLLITGNAVAAWQANLGAVQMARHDLAGFPAGEWENGDNIMALAKAVDHFNLALAADPTQKTAHYRLGLVAMLNRDFSTAVAHLERAYRQDSRHRGIVKNLGYSYVWSGQYDAAARLLIAIPETRREMDEYTRWWQQQGQDDLAARARHMTQLP